MPEGALYVGRPTKYGNPFSAQRYGRSGCVKVYREYLENGKFNNPIKFEEWIAPLRGKNLCCWCPLDSPCHADVLLELANED